MQAEHIPVHLGAMPAAVAAVLEREQAPGRSWILNDPFAGGTHLPDITVITPAHSGGRLIGFAATRAHHADVGGRTAGSMPADSRSLEEEGVLIAPQPFGEAQIAGIVARDAPARRAARRPARPARRQRRGGATARAAGAAPGPGAPARRDRGGARLRRAPRGGGDRLAGRRRPRGARSRRGARGGPRAAPARDRRRRAPAARLRGQRRAARREPQLPARGHALGVLLRGASPDRPRHAAQCRRPPPDRGACARRARC